MMLGWFKSRQIRANADPTVFDADGNVLRTYDDVTLLQAVQTDATLEKAHGFSGIIPAGTAGTIIIVDSNSDETLVHLEFSIDHQLAFAHVAGNHVRRHQRREEKLKHA